MAKFLFLKLMLCCLGSVFTDFIIYHQFYLVSTSSSPSWKSSTNLAEIWRIQGDFFLLILNQIIYFYICFNLICLKFVPAQRWLHNIEHGAVVMLYHPCTHPILVQQLRYRYIHIQLLYNNLGIDIYTSNPCTTT